MLTPYAFEKMAPTDLPWKKQKKVANEEGLSFNAFVIQAIHKMIK